MHTNVANIPSNRHQRLLNERGVQALCKHKSETIADALTIRPIVAGVSTAVPPTALQAAGNDALFATTVLCKASCAIYSVDGGCLSIPLIYKFSAADFEA